MSYDSTLQQLTSSTNCSLTVCHPLEADDQVQAEERVDRDPRRRVQQGDQTVRVDGQRYQRVTHRVAQVGPQRLRLGVAPGLPNGRDVRHYAGHRQASDNRQWVLGGPPEVDGVAGDAEAEVVRRADLLLGVAPADHAIGDVHHGGSSERDDTLELGSVVQLVHEGGAGDEGQEQPGHDMRPGGALQRTDAVRDVRRKHQDDGCPAETFTNRPVLLDREVPEGDADERQQDVDPVVEPCRIDPFDRTTHRWRLSLIGVVLERC